MVKFKILFWLISGYFKIILFDTFGTLLGYFWGTFKILITILLGYFWDTFGILLGYF